MKCAIQSLKLQREVVFVTRYTGELLARRGRHDHGFLCRVRLGFRMKYCVPNLLRRFCGRVVAQVGSDESSRSRGHVALSTLGFAEEYDFAGLRIPRRSARLAASVQTSYLSHF